MGGGEEETHKNYMFSASINKMFYGNTTTLTCYVFLFFSHPQPPLSIIYGHFHHTMAEQIHCDRDTGHSYHFTLLLMVLRITEIQL